MNYNVGVSPMKRHCIQLSHTPPSTQSLNYKMMLDE